MADSNQVLTTFFGDENFPVEWESEDEKRLFWFLNDHGITRPISPMCWSLCGWWKPALDYIYKHSGYPYSKAWIGKRINGYLYTAIIPRDQDSAKIISPYYDWIMPAYIKKMPNWWKKRFLPEIMKNLEYIDRYDVKNANLHDLMLFLEEVITIQERHFCFRWIVHLALNQSLIDLHELIDEVNGKVSPSLLDRIFVSLEKRDWECLETLWKLKEKVAFHPELKTIFDSGEHATAILPALRASESGRKFLKEIEKFLNEFGMKTTKPTYDYINLLWMEDTSPAIETIMGYLKSNYDYPSHFQGVVDDQKAALQELRSLIPDDVSEEQKEELETKLDLTIRIKSITPDIEFYIDQGTFGRMRLVLCSLAKKMVAEGLIDDTEEIMFLQYDQLRSYIADPKSVKNPDGYDGKSIIEESKLAFHAAYHITPKDWVGTVTHWNMYLEPFHKNWGYPYRFERTQTNINKPKHEVHGSPASLGIIEGFARVLKEPEDFDQLERDEILVCMMTDSAWVLILSEICGVVTDTGGVLGHTAVVAREFGIPAVVGTRDATCRIKTGDRIRVNGNVGLVEILGK